MQNRSRRGVLALLSGGVVGIAGCTAFSDGNDQRATDTPVDGTQTPVNGTQTPVDETDDQSVRWTTGFQSSRLLPAIADGTVYVPEASVGETAISQAVRDPTARDRRKIHALSLSDGSERWTHTYDTDEIHQAPTVGGTRCVTVTDEHVYYALGFLPAEQVSLGATEDELEDLREQMYRGPNVVALDREDGSVVWRATVGAQARVFQPMIAGPDNLYALHVGFNRDQSETDIYVIDRESGDVRGSFGPVKTIKPFAVADGTLYTHRTGAIQAWERAPRGHTPSRMILSRALA